MASWQREIRSSLRGLAFISPWLIGFLVFTLVPVSLSLYYSFCKYKLLQPPLFTGFDNYTALWSDPVFWKALRNTMYFGAVALPLGMIASLGVAMLLNAKIRGVLIYRTIVFLPSGCGCSTPSWG
jgi:multiple sugar transport system permease protein